MNIHLRKFSNFAVVQKTGSIIDINVAQFILYIHISDLIHLTNHSQILFHSKKVT